MFRRKNKIDPDIIRSLNMDLGFDHISPKVRTSFEVWFRNLPNFKVEVELSDIGESEKSDTNHTENKYENDEYFPDYEDDEIAKAFLIETLRELEADYLDLENPIIGMKRNFNMMMRLKLEELIFLIDEPIKVKMFRSYLTKLGNFVTAYIYYIREL